MEQGLTRLRRITVSLFFFILGGFFVFQPSQTTAEEQGILSENPIVDRGELTENDASIEQERQIEKEIKGLQGEIDEQAKVAEDLETKIETLNQNIKKRQKEQITLETEIANLDDHIAATDLEIQKTEIIIQKLTLELDQLARQIEERQRQILDRKTQLKQLLRQLYELDQKTNLEIVMTKGSFSDYFSQVTYTEQVQEDFQSTLKEIKKTKATLDEMNGRLEENKGETDKKKQDLDSVKSDFDSQSLRKQILLSETEESEEKFQDLIQEAKEEFQAANDAIVINEKVIRKKLREKAELKKQNGGEAFPFEEVGDEPLIWPVSGRTITTQFKDPDYPFRYLFEHPGLDISSPQGSVVTASASGYVGVAKNGGSGGYSYIMIVHANGLSTVYGHLSRIDVNVDDYIEQGMVIGLSGGMPGTPGAGRITTGPHMHFEVRLDGIPVNPLNYLP